MHLKAAVNGARRPDEHPALPVRPAELAGRPGERGRRGSPAAARWFIAMSAVQAGLPGVYLTLAGTDATPEVVAEATRRSVESMKPTRVSSRA